jgi:hypothetical protein
MSVLDNAFGLMDSPRLRINGCTWRIPVRDNSEKPFRNVSW